MVVLGAKSRVHVFSMGGAHVTSLNLDKDSVGRRLRRGRWVPAPVPVREAFQDAISKIERVDDMDE